MLQKRVQFLKSKSNKKDKNCVRQKSILFHHALAILIRNFRLKYELYTRKNEIKITRAVIPSSIQTCTMVETNNYDILSIFIHTFVILHSII